MAKEWREVCRTHLQSGVPRTYPAPVSVPDTGEPEKMEGPSNIACKHFLFHW